MGDRQLVSIIDDEEFMRQAIDSPPVGWSSSDRTTCGQRDAWFSTCACPVWMVWSSSNG